MHVPRRRYIVAILVAIVLLVGVAYAVAVKERYGAARASANAIEERYGVAGASGSQLGNLPQMTEDLRQLEADIAGLQQLVDVPVLGRLAREAPVIGNDIEASQRFLALGRELTDIAADTSEIANRVRIAAETSGIRTGDDVQGQTWLDVVRESAAEIDAIEARFLAVVEERNAIADGSLPDRAQAMLPRLDELLAKATSIHDEYYPLMPLLDIAFGAEDQANYVILLQNREEIRPAGGFPGTFASIAIDDGQLASHEISDIRVLDRDYVERRAIPITSPGPIRHVLGQEELLPHDSLWSPDFSESATKFEQVYSEAGWPKLTGVIGMNDSVVRGLLTIIGPYKIAIDGQTYLVSADTYLSLIEAHRDQTWVDLAAHKQVVSLLGSSLIDRIIASDFATKKAIYFLLRQAADERELQVRMYDPLLQAEVARREWDGALTPDPSISTLASSIAGLTGGKKALTIYQQSLIELDQVGNDLHVRWTITIDHRGDPNGNPVYNGYEYAWLSMYVPEQAHVIATSRVPAPSDIEHDPRATSFGIAVMPGTAHATTIEFTIPTSSQLLLRRQSGVNNAEVRITGDFDDCQLDWTLSLSRDYIVDVSACVVRPAR